MQAGLSPSLLRHWPAPPSICPTMPAGQGMDVLGVTEAASFHHPPQGYRKRTCDLPVLGCAAVHTAVLADIQIAVLVPACVL
jgi:hypothetical protein